MRFKTPTERSLSLKHFWFVFYYIISGMFDLIYSEPILKFPLLLTPN